MIVVEHEHQRPTTGAPLLDNLPRSCREELHPRDRTRGRPVHTLDIRAPRTQRGEVNPHPTTTGHDLSHRTKRVNNPLPTVFGFWETEAVIERDLVISTGPREDPSTRNKLEVLQNAVEAVF